MPRRLPDPVLDLTDLEIEETLATDFHLDGLVAEAKRCVAGHPELGHLNPDVRYPAYSLARPAKVMMRALMRTAAGKGLKASARREIVKAILVDLDNNAVQVRGEENLARDQTAINCQMLMLGSGWYRLDDRPVYAFQAVKRQPPFVAGPKPAVAPGPRAAPTVTLVRQPPVLPSHERAMVYAQPIPEEAEEEPDIDAMLAMMGNLPPMTRTGH